MKKQPILPPDITKLEFKDEQYFLKEMQNGQLQYAKNFLYILRTSHNEDGSLGYKYISEKLIVVLGLRNNAIYVTPVKDTTKGKLLKELCENLQRQTNEHIFIKKFSPEFYTYFKQQNSEKLSTKFLEDDAEPETIIHLRSLINSNGDINPKAHKFAKLYRRFKKEQVKLLIEHNIKNISLNKLIDFLLSDRNKYVNYVQMISFLHMVNKNPSYKTMVFLRNGDVVGIYAASNLSSKIVGLYCAVTSKDMPGITEWMDWYFIKELVNEGIEELYLGGSENAGVYYYIKKLLPEKTPYFVTTYKFA